MKINKKNFSRLFVTSVAAVSLFSVVAYAEDKEYPTLAQAPEIIFAQEKGNDDYTSVYVSWENTKEFNDLMAAYDLDKEQFAAEHGFDEIRFYSYVQIAYSLNGGKSWVNDFDRDEEIPDYYRPEVQIPGAYISSTLSTNDAVGDRFGDGMYLFNLVYYGDKEDGDLWAAYLTQGKAEFNNTDDLWNYYQVDLLGDDKLLMKSRYVISGEIFDENGDYLDKFNTYSAWSEIFMFGTDVDADYLGFQIGEAYKAPQIELLGCKNDEYLVNIGVDGRLRRFLAQYEALSSTYDGPESYYGNGTGYMYWHLEIKVNDGEWFAFDSTIGQNNAWTYILPKHSLTEELLRAGIELQPEDTISFRVKLLPEYQKEWVPQDGSERGCFVPSSEGCFAYTPVSNEITISPSGLYRIIYDLNYGSFKEGVEEIRSFEEEDNFVIDLTASDYIPEKEGYDFGGWYTTEDFKKGTEITSIDVSKKQYYRIYAKWLADEYKIEYDYGVCENVSVSNGNPDMYTSKTPAERLVLSDAYTSGVTFLGWYLNSDCTGNKVTAIDPTWKKDIKLYAKWDLPTYKITYVLNGGVNADNPALFVINITGEEARIKAPTKKSWLFDGWYYTEDFHDPLNYDEGKDEYILEASGDVTIYARWTEGFAAISYVDVVDGNKSGLYYSNAANPEVYEYLSEVKLADVTAVGYTFGGWYTDAKCTVKATGVSKTDRGAKTFYAKWTELSYSVKYVLDQDKTKSPSLSLVKNSNPINRKYSVEVTLLAPSCSDPNYIFDGWYLNSNLNGNKVEKLSGTFQGTLYAKWNKKSGVRNPFIDVPNNAWYLQAVLDVYERGAMTGDDGKFTFRPTDYINRAEAAALVYKMEGSPKIVVAAAPFPDVAANHWSAGPITWAKKYGIITGHTGGDKAGTYGGKDLISRQQFIKILYGYAQFKGYDVSVKNPKSYLVKSDAGDVSDYAKVMVNWGFENEFMGKENAQLNPKASIKRSEVATMVSRFYIKYDPQ